MTSCSFESLGVLGEHPISLPGHGPSRGKAMVKSCVFLQLKSQRHVITASLVRVPKAFQLVEYSADRVLNDVCSNQRREYHSTQSSDGTGSIGAPRPFRSIQRPSNPPGPLSTSRSCRSASCSDSGGPDGIGRRLSSSARDADIRRQTILSCHGTAHNSYRIGRGDDLSLSGTRCNSTLRQPNARQSHSSY